MRWDPYLMLRGQELDSLWSDYSNSTDKKLLLVLGKGFDPRMNLGVLSILKGAPMIGIEVFLIDFTEGENTSSLNYKHFVDHNMNQLKIIIGHRTIKVKSIKTWDGIGRRRRRVGDRRASEVFKDMNIEEYSDIIVDISSLPRGIYFSMIGSLLASIDRQFAQNRAQPNLLILTAENAEIDSRIKEEGIDEELHLQFGFAGGGGLEALNKPTIWLPILGEGKVLHFEKAYRHLGPDEICPLLPFPSKNPRRSDDIFAEHQSLFVDQLDIEPQNIIYVPEQNPFEVYKKLLGTVRNYGDSLSILHGCKAVISSFSSKLLSLGAFLAAYEAKSQGSGMNIGILNVDSQGYRIEDVENLESLNEKSELFVIWLSGLPYQ